MSRLFEALSNLQVKRNPQGVVSFSMASPVVVRPQRSAIEDAPPEQVTEADAETQEFPPDIAPNPPTGAGSFRPKAVTANPHFPATEHEESDAQGVHSNRDEAGPEVRLHVDAPPESRLVALTNPNDLGAEKFRALVTRLDHQRKARQLTSFQVTSSVIHEGKTLLSANVAVTLAKYSGCKTLLIEGDLHRPALSPLFGFGNLRGLSDWWLGGTLDLAPFLYRLDDMPLWYLSAGGPCDRPSEILRSERFAKAFALLASRFEWTVVDSTPMLPIVDVNLWSKLVDGTLLVVREGLTPVKALKKGLQALDHPKLIGVVWNEATISDHENYDSQYYSAGNPAAGRDETSK